MDHYTPLMLGAAFFGGWGFAKFLRWLEAPIVKTWQDCMLEEQDRHFKSLKDGKCGCHTCTRNRGEVATRMVLCPECGNKRCPKATDHRLACTASNEPGQVGSIYE